MVLGKKIKTFLEQKNSRSRNRAIPEFMIRPFTEEDFQYEILDSETANGPSFVCIGAPKTGTTFLKRLLDHHPDVVPNKLGRKELHYFDHFINKPLSAKDIATYRIAFSRKAGQSSGDFSPSYMHYPGAIDRLYQAAPETKIIYIIRNPVDRTISHVNQVLNSRCKMYSFSESQLELFFRTTILPEAIYSSMYLDKIQKSHQLFGIDNTLVIQYEKLKKDPGKMVGNILSFLGLKTFSFEHLLKKDVNRIPYKIPNEFEVNRKSLELIFRDDVKMLNEHDFIDISLWSDFYNLKNFR